MLGVGRYSSRLYVAYSTFYALGTLLAMQIRFVGFQAVQSSEHMLALLAFGALQVPSPKPLFFLVHRRHVHI
eukprot:SAG11_NODE_3354_length_2506_cov_0.999585_1_plen_72_part_00